MSKDIVFMKHYGHYVLHFYENVFIFFFNKRKKWVLTLSRKYHCFTHRLGSAIRSHNSVLLSAGNGWTKSLQTVYITPGTLGILPFPYAPAIFLTVVMLWEFSVLLSYEFFPPTLYPFLEADLEKRLKEMSFLPRPPQLLWPRALQSAPVFHADNEIMLLIEAQNLLRHKALAPFLVPESISHSRHHAQNSLSHSYFPLFPELFQVLGPVRCKPLLSKTVSYVSQFLVSFFLTFLSPLQSRFPTFHLLHLSVHTDQHHDAGRTCIFTVYGCVFAISTEKCISLWDSHRVVHILDHTISLLVRPNLSTSTIRKELLDISRPIKRKTVSQSSEWHNTALSNYKSHFFSPSYYSTTGFPPWL